MGRAAEVCCRRIVAARKWGWKEGSDKEELLRFVAAFGRISVGMPQNDAAFLALEQWAENESERTARVAAYDAAERYRRWLQEGPAGGLARQHAAS